MTPKSLLIVEDEARLRDVLMLEFAEKGYNVAAADSIKTIKPDTFDYAIVDLRLKGDSGLDVIKYLKEISPTCRIIVLTGYGTISSAVEAIKLGAINYLTKPADSDKIEKALIGENLSDAQEDKTISLNQNESEYIEYMLIKHEGNISKTAAALGLHRQSLQRKLKKRVH